VGLDIYQRRGWRGNWPAVRATGSLTLFGQDGAERATSGLAGLTEAGHPAELLTASQVRDRFPGLAPAEDQIGVFEPRGGWLPARAVAEAMLHDAGPGVTVLPARATELVTAGDRVAGVRTTAGFVAGRAILLAAGAGSTELARTAGVALPLRNRAVSYCVFAPKTADPSRLPSVVDATTGAWLRPWHTGGAVLAGVTSLRCDVPAEVSDGVPAAERDRVRAVLRHRYPALADADVVGGVTAYDAMAADGDGTVAVWPQAPGLVTATGWNGGGFKLAPAIGAQAASRLRELVTC
jgi:glycine/D-amino acid oxidase-like deaminating enzyme